jgi:hypothetical protein
MAFYQSSTGTRLRAHLKGGPKFHKLKDILRGMPPFATVHRIRVPVLLSRKEFDSFMKRLKHVRTGRRFTSNRDTKRDRQLPGRTGLPNPCRV